MWTINANQIIAKFPDGNGGPWTTFLDRLIRVQTSLAGVPHSAIHTNQRVNLGDAGVDTQVDQPIPQDVTGRLQFPTCWQYKAEAYKSYTPSKKNKKLAAEINKHYAVELIEKGYAYRFCICDSFPAPTRAKWLACLKAEKDRISPYAPDPLVMTADDVATWVSQFPGLVREFFRQELREIQDLETWGRAAKQTTKTYVPVTAWRSFQESLAAHADLSRPCHDVGLSLQGEAGVGKTRGTYESLAVVPGAEGLVLYTSDERLALSVARHLLNDNHAHAILVADECLVGTRATLEDLLGPVSERVRLITITNTGTRPPGGSPEFWLEHITPENIREILQQNFPTLPQDRRALYADLAGGFVRLAVQLCRDHALIERHGISVGTSRRIREYLELVLGSDTDKEKTLLALSLCRRVGYREDVAAELDALCTLVSIDRARTQELANRMKDVPGF